MSAVSILRLVKAISEQKFKPDRSQEQSASINQLKTNVLIVMSNLSQNKKQAVTTTPSLGTGNFISSNSTRNMQYFIQDDEEMVLYER